jgi:uncharacterized delta-60 repeat protein
MAPQSDDPLTALVERGIWRIEELGGAMKHPGLIGRALVVSLLLPLVLQVAALAAAGDLDRTFGGNGKVVTGFAGGASGFAVAIQDDGNIVVVGDAALAPSSLSHKFALARYTSTGALDATFGGDGKVTTPFGRDAVARGVAIQDDGKIVVVGRVLTASGEERFGVIRYNPNGDLDASFGEDGKVTTEFAGRALALDVAIQADGRIVVAGSVSPTPHTDRFAVARYTPEGALDATFGEGGKVTTRFGDRANAAGVAIQADGKIVVAGTVDQVTESGLIPVKFGVARYTPNGTLDDAFSGDGKVTTGFGQRAATVSGVEIQADGKIVVAGGHVIDDDTHRFAAARYTSAGALDDTFSGNGKVTTGFGDLVAFALGVAIQPDGKIVLAGEQRLPSGRRKFALARYNPNGTLDETFGANGKVTTGFAVGDRVATASGVAIQPDGKIVAAGSVLFPQPKFAVARYLAA